MSKLPAPKKKTQQIIEITTGLTGVVIDTIIPGVGSTIRGAVSIAIRQRMERGEAILLEEIRRSGLDALDNEQLDFFVPAYYRFLEQVRLGEYEHNLMLLAKLITGCAAAEAVERDVGRVGRAAQKLHLLSRAELDALAHCLRIFDNPLELSGDRHALFLTPRDFAARPRPDGVRFIEKDALQMLHELSIRGLLTYAGTPAINGAPAYYRNKALDEISYALAATVSQEHG